MLAIPFLSHEFLKTGAACEDRSSEDRLHGADNDASVFAKLGAVGNDQWNTGHAGCDICSYILYSNDQGHYTNYIRNQIIISHSVLMYILVIFATNLILIIYSSFKLVVANRAIAVAVLFPAISCSDDLLVEYHWQLLAILISLFPPRSVTSS